MSSTITETERRSVLSPSAPAETLSSKRQNLSRTGSIEKLKKFNNFICSQHYYILPSLLLWLKTSQTLLTACIVHLKSMFLLCTLRVIALLRCAVGAADNRQTKHEQFAAFDKLTSRDVLPVLNILLVQLCVRCLTVGQHVKYIALVVAVYCAVFVVFLQLVACVLLICLKTPPIGFIFLVLCVCFMGRIAAQVMLTDEHKRQKPIGAEHQKQTTNDNKTKDKRVFRKRLSLIGKTISNIKLF